MAKPRPLHQPWLWGAGIALVIAAVTAINQSNAATGDARMNTDTGPMVSSGEVERYAQRLLEAQRTYFVARKQYASDLEQLGVQPPSAGIAIDYRGSSPLGFCWLARAENDVWYTTSQRQVARSEQGVTAAPPISCR